jgi:hypothetical protein
VASNIEARLGEGRVASLPGITAAVLGGLPAEGYAYRLERGDTLRGAAMPLSYRVSPGYFRTLGIRLLAGREFLASDRAGATPSGIVSRTATRTWWPGEDPIGRRLFMANAAGVGEWVTIVGVAEDERVRRNMRAPIGPVLYRPFDQLTGERRLSHIFARTEGRPAPSIPAVRAVIEGLRGGAGWQGERVAAMTEILGGTLDQPRFRMWALTLVSAFGLLLAAMGIYGVVSTIVSQRTTEIGIRVALGARPVDVLVLVSRRGIGLAAGGIALGVAGSFALSRVLQALLVNNAGTDSSAPLAAGVFLAAVVIFACYVPARRAARVDPITALRES